MSSIAHIQVPIVTLSLRRRYTTKSSRPEEWYGPGKIVVVNDLMQQNYSYILTEEVGHNFHPDFRPQLTPKEMLALGVFEGKYCNDCRAEFPKEWFQHAKISETGKADVLCNHFKIKARSPLHEWEANGWVHPVDPRGWFQWYMRYYLGRRIPSMDIAQIKRWRQFKRHVVQIQENCLPNCLGCRMRQRQAILQWAYNPFF